MKYKKILLVATDNLEILNVQRELARYNPNHTLHVARSGMEALSLLMGCSSPHLEDYSKTGKVQPDYLIMDADSIDVHAIDLLCIMQKYYSLQKIKIYMMAESPESVQMPDAAKCSITGFLSKPFDMNAQALDNEKFRNEFSVIQKAWLPAAGLSLFSFDSPKLLASLLRIKALTLQATGGLVATKTTVAAAFLAVAVVMSPAVSTKTGKQDTNESGAADKLASVSVIQPVQTKPLLVTKEEAPIIKETSTSPATESPVNVTPKSNTPVLAGDKQEKSDSIDAGPEAPRVWAFKIQAEPEYEDTAAN